MLNVDECNECNYYFLWYMYLSFQLYFLGISARKCVEWQPWKKVSRCNKCNFARKMFAILNSYSLDYLNLRTSDLFIVFPTFSCSNFSRPTWPIIKLVWNIIGKIGKSNLKIVVMKGHTLLEEDSVEIIRKEF